MRRLRQIAPLFLAAIFWIAQLQGAVHGIGHLNAAAGVSDHATAPHSMLCVECAAFAQAGAAPLLAIATNTFVPTADSVSASVTPAIVVAAAAAAYRSRAPPSSPI